VGSPYLDNVKRVTGEDYPSLEAQYAPQDEVALLLMSVTEMNAVPLLMLRGSEGVEAGK
jgi:hypothetical protein